MATLLKVKIITPKEVAFEGKALAVTIPAEAGEMQVYQGHVPVLAHVVPGTIRVDFPKDAPLFFQNDEGFLRVTANEVSLLIDNAQPLQT